jgi:hypothetical protein
VAAPSGSEAPSSDRQDPFLEARAYHFSVYLMVGMPYLLLGGVGLLIYRAVKQKERASDGGRDSWQDPSRGDVS